MPPDPVFFKCVTDLLEGIEIRTSPESLRRRRPGKIRPVQSSAQITNECVETWFDTYREDIARQPRTLLAILSTLLPDNRPDRVYEIKEDRLAKILNAVLGTAGTRREADILGWRLSPEGNLPDVVERIMKAAVMSKGCTVSIETFDDVMDRLAARSQFSSKEIQDLQKSESKDEIADLLRPLYTKFEAVEAKWATRIILRNIAPVVLGGMLFQSTLFLQSTLFDADRR